MRKTWEDLITAEMLYREEDFNDVIKTTLSDEELRKDFDIGYGEPEGEPFTLWTKRFVYFPVEYDGAESVASVPRNPCDEKTEHIGG